MPTLRVVGPGRAGTSLARALAGAGWDTDVADRAADVRGAAAWSPEALARRSARISALLPSTPGWTRTGGAADDSGFVSLVNQLNDRSFSQLHATLVAPADVDTAAVARSTEPFDLDVGPGPNGAPLVVYSRRGDLFQFDPATGAEQPLAEVNTNGTEVHPSIRRNALAFVRTARGRKARPTLYLRKGELSPGNLPLVQRAVHLAAALDRPAASVEETAALLRLPSR